MITRMQYLKFFIEDNPKYRFVDKIRTKKSNLIMNYSLMSEPYQFLARLWVCGLEIILMCIGDKRLRIVHLSSGLNGIFFYKKWSPIRR